MTLSAKLLQEINSIPLLHGIDQEVIKDSTPEEIINFYIKKVKSFKLPMKEELCDFIETEITATNENEEFSNQFYHHLESAERMYKKIMIHKLASLPSV